MIYSAYEAQIALVLAKKVIVVPKYLDFAKIFLKNLAEVLLKQLNINKYIIKFGKNK